MPTSSQIARSSVLCSPLLLAESKYTSCYRRSPIIPPPIGWHAATTRGVCLAGGLRLFLYQQRMVHAKTATIDGIWSTIGTANLDRLSLVSNFEVNVAFYNERLARQMEDIFLKDTVNAHELMLEEWQHRPLFARLAELLLLPLRPFL